MQSHQRRQHTNSQGFSPTFAAVCFLFISVGALSREIEANPLEKWQSAPLTVAAIKEMLHNSEALLQAATITTRGIFWLSNFLIGAIASIALLTKDLFLGPHLSATEKQNLVDRLLYFLLTKAALISVIFSNSLLRFVLPGAVAISFMKAFNSLAKDRSEALVSNIETDIYLHVRCMSLLWTMLACDIAWMCFGLQMKLPDSSSQASKWALLWLFDGIGVAVEALNAIIRYSLQLWGCEITHKGGKILVNAVGSNLMEQKTPLLESKAEAGDVDESSYFLYLMELVVDLILGGLDLANYVYILRFRGGIKLRIDDLMLLVDLRFATVNFYRRGVLHLNYRKLTHKLQHCFPTASTVHLLCQGHSTCAICMEEMKYGKVLPCGHVFHLGCLRTWLQQSTCSASFTCPLCRSNLLLDTMPCENTRSASLEEERQHSSSSLSAATVYDCRHSTEEEEFEYTNGGGDIRERRPRRKPPERAAGLRRSRQSPLASCC